MNKWEMKAGRFTDGECSLRILTVWDMVVDCGDSPQVQANWLGVSCEHFVRLAMLACRVLSVPGDWVHYWTRVYNTQKERQPQ